MSREEILKKNGLEVKKQVQDKVSNTREEILQKNGFATTQKSTPTFKTPQEALDYANSNNINVKIEPKKSLMDKVYDNVIQPMNNFNEGVFYNTGKTLAKPIYKLGVLATDTLKNPWQNNTNIMNNAMNNLYQLKGMDKTLPVTEPLKIAQEKTDTAFKEFEDRVGLTQREKTKAGQAGQTVGNTLGYVGSSLALGGNPVSFGTVGGLQTFGNTNDVGDIALNTAKSYAFGKVNNVLGKIVGNTIGKAIPATQTNLLANIGKNAVAGASSMYGAGAITGEVENTYNLIRNKIDGTDAREVDWIKPIWSDQALSNVIVGGIFGGINGTKADLAKAKAQIQNDYNALGNDLSQYSNEMNVALKNGDLQSAKVAYNKGLEAINKFADTKYLGYKATDIGKQTLEDFWGNIAKKNQINYNPTRLEAQNISQNQISVQPQITNQTTQNNANSPQNNHNNVNISQKNVQNVSNLEKETKNDTERFAQQVDSWKNNTWDTRSDLTVLERTPQLYQDLGLNDLPITITSSKLERIYYPNGRQKGNYHNLQGIVKALPRALSNPLNIVESSTVDNSIVVITDLSDANDNIVIVSLKPDGYGKLEIDDIVTRTPANAMTSAYGKENYEKWMGSNLENNKVIYDIDEGILKKRTDGKWLQLPSSVSPSSISSTTNTPINSILPRNENYVNNQKNIGFPTTEELQKRENSKIAESPIVKANENAFKQHTKKTNFMLVNDKNTYKRNMFENNAKAINDLIKAKNITAKEFEQKILEKQTVYDSKKDKTTKVAQNLKSQIVNLEKKRADSEAKFINQIDRLENRNAVINKLKTQVSEDRLPTRKEIKNRIISEKDLEEINFDNAKNLSKFIMNNTTPQRVNEKIFDRDTANKINERFFKPIKHNEADRIRFLNKEREDISNWGIKPKSKESMAVQMYGEGEWINPQTGEVSPYTLQDLKNEFPNDWEKIKDVSEKARKKYDKYIDLVNKRLNEMGYDSIPKLKNYFRHFEETTSLLDKFGIPSKMDSLPTDLNGLTADLKPR